ncbi:hypothetical protein VZT92_008455 [Zoarces viviparus]
MWPFELTPARWISLQRAAAPPLCGDRPWRSVGRPGGRSEFSAKVVARLPSGGEGGGSPALPSDAVTPSVRKERKKDGVCWSGAEERRGKTREVGGHLLMDSHYLCPLSGHPGHSASLSGESR